MKTLTQRVSRLEKIVKEYKQAVTTIEIPYTAMRSTGDYWIDEFVDFQSDTKKRLVYLEKQFIKHTEGQYLHGGTENKPIKPQEDVRKIITKIILTWREEVIGMDEAIDRILAIVKGE